MMKKAILSTVAMLIMGMAFAQEGQTVRIPSGYQGFLDQASIYRAWDKGNTTVSVSTTHGFYFNGNTFVGIGFGIEGGNDFFAMPLYTAVKYNFSYTSNVTPTMQVRVGSYVSDKTGAYADMGFGVRFGSRRDFAVNIMLVGSFYQPQTTEVVESYADGTRTSYTEKFNPSGIGLRVGIEW